jgi:ribosomal protein S18 acetylase RimI-like enzyme
MAALESAALAVEFSIVVRLATAADLPKLEWFGQFTHFRNLFHRTFREQQQGRRLMLIADCNGFPIGQIFVQLHSDEFNQPHGQRRAYLYSLRVMDMFQGKGIGTLLLDRAETNAAKAGFLWTSIAAAKDNLAARRMYEHRGYRVFAEDSGDWNYLDHQGKVQHVHEPCWILEKRLRLR